MFPASKRYHRSVFHLYQNCASLAKRTEKTCESTKKNSPRARFGAGRPAALPPLPCHCCQATSIGAATAIEEYVPIRIPTTSANEKPLSTWPPKMQSESTVRKV